MGHKNAWELIPEILKLSKAKTWKLAVAEWIIQNFYIEQNGTCLCSHHPITEHFVLYNEVTGNTAIVGNVCVGHFGQALQKEANLIFDGFKRIIHDLDKSANEELLHYSAEMEFITAEELEYYLRIFRKRILTDQERTDKLRLNIKIVEGYNELNPQRPFETEQTGNRSATKSDNSITPNKSEISESDLSPQDNNANPPRALHDSNLQTGRTNSTDLLGHRRKLEDEENDLKVICGECSLCEEKCDQKSLKKSLCGHVTGCQGCWEELDKKHTKCSICKEEYATSN